MKHWPEAINLQFNYMDKSASKHNQHDGISTLDSQSSSMEKSRSKAVSLSKLPREPILNLNFRPTRVLKFMNNSFTAKPIKLIETNCEIVFEEELEETEVRHKKFKQIIPILDKKEELLFHSNRTNLLVENAERPRSTDLALPKIIENKDEYSYFYEKPKYKFSNYLAMIDKTERFRPVTPKTNSEIREDQLFDSNNAIEEVNQCEEDLGMADEILENRSMSVKSGSLSRISNNSFIKKRLVDECVIFDREKEMSEIVS